MKAVRRAVLLVEDDPDDVLLLREALEDSRGLVDLKVAQDGEQALSYLRGNPLPALVLLDWRLPGMSGLDVLRAIRKDPALKAVPVLVLTTSASERDKRDAYESGANSFMTKPSGLDATRELMAALETFWLFHADLI